MGEKTWYWINNNISIISLKVYKDMLSQLTPLILWKIIFWDLIFAFIRKSLYLGLLPFFKSRLNTRGLSTILSLILLEISHFPKDWQS